MSTNRRYFFIVFFLLSIIDRTHSQCSAPTVDAIFVLDGTLNVGNANFQKMKQFVANFVNRMDISAAESRVGVMQFTPTARPEFYPLNYMTKELVKTAVNKIPFVPCLGTDTACWGSVKDGRTLNYVAQFGLSPASGNRPRIPDAMIVLVGEAYKPKVYLLNETLYEPLSALYVFIIRVGINEQKLNLNIPYASKVSFQNSHKFWNFKIYVIEMHSPSYQQLNDLTEPLCQEMATYVDGETLSQGQQAATVGSASFSWLPFLILFVVALLVLILIGWLLCRYQRENEKLRVGSENGSSSNTIVNQDIRQWASTRPVNGKFVQAGNGALHNGALHNGHGSSTDGTVMSDLDLEDERNRHRRESRARLIRDTSGVQNEAFDDDVDLDRVDKLQHAGVGASPRKGKNTGRSSEITTGIPRLTYDLKDRHRNSLDGTSPRKSHRRGADDISHSDSETLVIESPRKGASKTTFRGNPSTTPYGHHPYGTSRTDGALSRFTVMQDGDHPSRRLPPVDLLIMIDNSGSIGMVNFQKVKDFVCKVLDNVYIKAGKSRVACVTFSTQPDLTFSFDKYNTMESVQAAIQRIPFGGGSTFVGRALQFATGILAQEKSTYIPIGNMKGAKRAANHQPTSPRPEPVLGRRLQTVLVMTDGYSEDPVENASKTLQNKINARIAAVGLRTFRKEKLASITGYDESVFLVQRDVEAVSNWLLKQQSNWLEVNSFDPVVYGNLPDPDERRSV